MGYYADLVTTILLLLLLCAGMMATPLRAKVRNGWTWDETALSLEGGVGFHDFFVVVLLLHPTISGKAMEFFRCQRINGVSYLMADYAIVCHDATWWAFLPLVVLVLVGFSLGTPAAIFFVLRRRRATLYEEDGKVKEQPLDILYSIYNPHAYYFESVQMVSAALLCPGSRAAPTLFIRALINTSLLQLAASRCSSSCCGLRSSFLFTARRCNSLPRS